MGTPITSHIDARAEYERLFTELTASSKLVLKAEDWVVVESSQGQEITLKIEQLNSALGGYGIKVNNLLVVEQGYSLSEILAQVAEPTHLHKMVTSHTTKENPVLSKLDTILTFPERQVTASQSLRDEGMVEGRWGTSASGIMFKCEDEVLLLKRAAWTSAPNTWSVPGGAIPLNDDGDKIDAFESALKECTEEIGLENTDLEAEGSAEFTDGNFSYTTFVVEVGAKFTPELNNEHDDFRWVKLTDIPMMDDVHPGVIFALDEFGWFQGKGKVETDLDEEVTTKSTLDLFVEAIQNSEYTTLSEIPEGLVRLDGVTLYRGIEKEAYEKGSEAYEHPGWHMWTNRKDLALRFAKGASGKGYLLTTVYSGIAVDCDKLRNLSLTEYKERLSKGERFSNEYKVAFDLYKSEEGSFILPPHEYTILELDSEDDPFLLTVESYVTKAANKTYKPRLNEQQLAKYWYETAYADYDSKPTAAEIEDYMEMIPDTADYWELQTLNIADIEGHHQGHDASEEYIKDYSKRKSEGSDFPPIIVTPNEEHSGKYTTVDGQHRLFAAKANGETTIRAYVPVDLQTSNFSAYDEKFVEEMRKLSDNKTETAKKKSGPLEYRFGKEVHTDHQISEKPFEKDLRELGKYRTGHAYGNLPARINLYLDNYGMPDMVHNIVSIYPKRGVINAIYFQVGKQMIQIWKYVDHRLETSWKTFEKQAYDAGYQIKDFTKGEIEDSHGYWLDTPTVE